MKQLLLNENRKLLKTLNLACGFNWESDEVIVKKVELPKTLNAIIKENPEITKDTYNVMLIQDRHNDTKFGVFKIISFTVNGDFNIDGTNDMFRKFWSRDGVENYYRKSDFNEDRKNKDLKAFIVVAPLKSLKYVEYRKKENEIIKAFDKKYQTLRAKVDFSEKNIRLTYFSNSKDYRIRRIENIMFNNTKVDFDFHDYPFSLREDYESPYDLIDKSGYNVRKFREVLREKVNAIKTQKDKKVLLHTDFTKENYELNQKLESVKTLIAQKIMTATDLYKVGNRLQDLSWVVNRYNTHLQKLREIANPDASYYNSYGSVKSVKETIDYMNKQVDEILEKCNEL